MSPYPIYRFPLDVEVHNLDHHGNLISIERSTDSTSSASNDPQFCSTAEFSELSGLAVQTIYNMRTKGIFVEGVHYHRPNGGKLLFNCAAIMSWIETGHINTKRNITSDGNSKNTPPATKPKSDINI